MRRLAVNSSVLTVGAYLSQGASVISFAIAARSLGPALFGPLLGAIGVAVVVATFADFGINTWTVREMARDQNDPLPFITTLSAKLILATLLGLAWAGAAYLLPAQPVDPAAMVLLGAYIALLTVAATLTVPFRASEKMLVVALIGTTEKAVTLLLVVGLYHLFAPRSTFLIIAYVGGSLFSVALALWLLPKGLRIPTWPALHDVANLWKNAFHFGMAGVASQLQRADVAVVAAVAGATVSGLYGAPARLTGLLSIVPASFAAAIFPRLAAAHEHKKALQEVLRAGAVMMVVLLVILAAAYAVAPMAITIALGPGYQGSVPVLRILLAVVALSALNQPLLVFLQASGHERFVSNVVIAGAAVGLISVAIGAAAGGAAGAAIGVGCLQLFLLLFLAIKALTIGPKAQSALTDPSQFPLASTSQVEL